ncbi:MAG: hypothetical protein AAGH48_09880 [Pseudomonadota bacterium]
MPLHVAAATGGWETKVSFQLGLGLSRVAGSAGLYSPASAAALAFYYDALSPVGVEATGGAVSALRNLGPFPRSAVQSNPSAQPQSSGGVLLFDGTSDALNGGETATASFVGATDLPDAQGGDPGKGFTCTGLDRAPDGSWWAGNDGRDTISGGSGQQLPSLVRLSSDFQTKLAEIDLTAIAPGASTVQGVAYDHSDDTLWFVTQGQNKVRNVTQAGVDTGRELSFGFTVNGLAYHPGADALWVHSAGGTNIRLMSKAGAELRLLGGFDADVDHLSFDNARQRLWTSRDPSIVSVWDVNDTLSAPFRVADYSVPEADQIEGLALNGDKLFIANDAYFHGGSPPLNRILEYDVTRIHQGSMLTDKTLLFGVYDQPSAPSGPTRALVSFGDPTAQTGLGLFAPAGTTNVRVMLNTAAGASELDIFDFAADATTTHLFAVEIDYAASTVEYFRNGAQVGSTRSLANSSGPVFLGNFFIGWSNDASGARFLNMGLRALGAAGSLADRQRIEGALAWLHGLEGDLDASHPYKAGPPQ